METTTPSREEALKRSSKIDGWLTDREAGLLYDLARNSSGPIVEIGSWQGRSTSAIALGSAAGRKQPVTAVDPFIGVQASPRKTSLDTEGADHIPTGPERLRANLDAAGVNGQVTILHKASWQAIHDDNIPEELGLVFVDGSHEYRDVCRDLDLYLPRLRKGGLAVLHDVVAGDPGVVKAVEDKISNKPNQYRIMDRVDSALVVRRVDTPHRNVFLACPGRGFDWGPVVGILQASLGAHQIDPDNNANGWDDFNALWARALNRAALGEITHFAMLHSDVSPQPGWVDLLLDELEETKSDLISVACPLKDGRAVLSCGVGDLDNPWGAWRRLTVTESLSLPPSFDLTTLRQRGFCGTPEQQATKYLLFNTGCWVCDLRSSVFHATDADGNLLAWFDFPTRVRKDKESGIYHNLRESEDWFFSRRLHMLGAKTLVTRKVRLGHEGKHAYRNDEAWGTWTEDEHTRLFWKPEQEVPSGH